jgi:hypothetical protein
MVRHPEHLEPGQDQEGREEEEDPFIAIDQRRPEADHDAAEQDDADYAPEQHPVLEVPRDGEEAEDQRDDEGVVHREALLDDEPGKVLEARARPELPPDEAAEAEAGEDVEGGEPEALANADLAVENAEVEGDQQGDENEEAEPHPARLAQKVVEAAGRPEPAPIEHPMRSDTATIASSEGPGPPDRDGAAADARARRGPLASSLERPVACFGDAIPATDSSI